MTNKLTFIHAADLHLDSPFKGLANIPEHIFSDVLESIYEALGRLVQAAIDMEVDFVLLSGDLFDNERQSLKAQITLRNAFEKLKSHEIHVYLSYGNHDNINGNVHPIEYPDNVYYFPDERVRSVIFQKSGRPKAVIYGFSYENQAVLTNKSHEYEVENPSIPFHIAMLHGSIASNTEHDTYAPFQLNDLTNKGMDYWALGHIHKRGIIKEDPPIVYPGNIQGRHRKELGEKGCYHVTLTETGSTLTFLPLQSIIFNTLTLDISKCKSVDQLEDMLKKHIDKHLKNSPQLIDLTLHSKEEQQIMQNDFIIEDLIDIVNDHYIKQKNWLYIYKFNINKQYVNEENKFLSNDIFLGELTRQMNEESITPYLNDLYQHRQARKYLEDLSEEEQDKVKQEAYQLLMETLLP